MEDYKKEADKYKIEGLKVLTPDDVTNMLVGAWEGGSNYWAYVSDKMMDKALAKTEDMQGEPTVYRVLMAIQRGLPVRVRDAENPSEILGVLTPERWAIAEDLMLKHHRSHFGDILKENDDASTADVFFQLAVMGELVYG